MAEPTRRAGCGCLSATFLLFVLIGSFVMATTPWNGDDRLGVTAAMLAAFLLLAVVTGIVVRTGRRRAREDSGMPAPPVPSRPPPARPTATRSNREMRSGPRRLSTEPESEEAQALKRRLTEAVSDLADNVEEMPDRQDTRRLTSEEMIARAKERIRRKSENPDL